MYTLSLEVINKCNLNCSYCYLGKKKNTFMSIETAKKAVDIAAHETAKQYDKTLTVYFIGGEPLMAYDTIRETVEYTKLLCHHNNLKYRFSTTINGTLVTAEIVDFLVKNKFEVKLSLDGMQKTHDLNRKDYAGNGSFNKIMSNFPLLKQLEKESGNQISVASVVTNNNYENYAENFKFLLDLGFEKLESGIDYYSLWSDEQLMGLKKQLEEVFQIYKSHIQKTGKVIFWNFWEQYVKSYLLPCPFYACKAGLATSYVTTDGGLYTCVEKPEFEIGNVDIGLDVPRIRGIAYRQDEIVDWCQECEYIDHCKTRGCQAANFEVHGNVHQPIKVNCYMTKWMYSLIEQNLSEKQLEKLKVEYERRYHCNAK